MSALTHEPDLLHAFSVFQQHCDQLEHSHQALRQRLNKVELELARRHQELQSRVREIEFMRDRLDTILATVEDAVFLLTPEGEVETANAAGLVIQPQFEQLIAGGALSLQVPRDARLRDVEVSLGSEGDEQVLLASIFPVREAKTRGGWVAVLRDITGYRRMEQRLAREQRLAALGKVAANVAHEVRNPLGAIEGFARLLTSDLREQPESCQLADNIVRAARQLNAVVCNLLSFTRELQLHAQPVELSELLQELVRFYSPSASDLGVELVLEPLPQVRVQGDPVQLHQALTNVLGNALDACKGRRDGQVTLTLVRQDDEAIISVRDTGCGMSPAVLERMCEPFFTGKTAGVGLGMALCQRILDLHGGHLEASSQLDRGSVICLQLPAWESTDD